MVTKPPNNQPNWKCGFAWSVTLLYVIIATSTNLYIKLIGEHYHHVPMAGLVAKVVYN